MVSVSKEVTKASSASKLNAHGQTSHGTASEWPRRYIRGSPPFGAFLFYSLSQVLLLLLLFLIEHLDCNRKSSIPMTCTCNAVVVRRSNSHRPKYANSCFHVGIPRHSSMSCMRYPLIFSRLLAFRFPLSPTNQSHDPNICSETTKGSETFLATKTNKERI